MRLLLTFRPLLCAVSIFIFAGAGCAEDETNAVTKTRSANADYSLATMEISMSTQTPKDKAQFINPAPDDASGLPTYLHDVLPILMGRCVRCHGDPNSVLANWLDYRTAFNDRVEIERRVWRSWKGSYYKQPMPAGNGAEAQAMTEDERRIIKRWVEAGAPCGVPPTDAAIHSKAEKINLGRRLYGTVCGVCHQPAGQGMASRFPPLARSDFLNADKHRAIKIVLTGLQGELVVNGQKFNNSMPKFPLSDQDIVNVLTYVYNSMGNSGEEITAEEVGAVRAENAVQITDGQVQPAKPVEEKSAFE